MKKIKILCKIIAEKKLDDILPKEFLTPAKEKTTHEK